MTTSRSESRCRSRERTVAVTWGGWGGVWLIGERGLIWRLCLGFVAITYLPAEMNDVLRAWVDRDELIAMLDAAQVMYDWGGGVGSKGYDALRDYEARTTFAHLRGRDKERWPT